jgi:phosphoribosylanthranilate isomerase
MIIQIYEIQEPHEAQKCMELGVDTIGSVLLSKDKWRISSLRDVFRSTKGTPTKNSLIPLFPNVDILYKALDYYQPDIVHFCETLTDIHGHKIDLDPFLKLQAEVKQKFPEIKIMRSIPIPQNSDLPDFPTLEIACSFEPVSDIFLTDTWLGEEPVEGYIGITGKTVDLQIAKDLVRQSNIPVMLAGGLSPENVYDAVQKTRPAGADSCTQTNWIDGNGKPIRFKKDFNKVKKFVEEMKRAEELIR